MMLKQAVVLIIQNNTSNPKMSISNNLDEKVLLYFMTKTLSNWGMLYINQQTLKLAKKNQSECLQPMTRLLFDLAILHIFNYQYRADELQIIFEDQEEMVDIVLAHLFEIDCPMLICFDQGETNEKTIGYDFSSSRHILMTCGWLMAVSDFFGQISSKLLNSKLSKIYKPKPLNLTSHHKKYTLPPSTINYHEHSPLLQRISFLSKSLQSRKYSLECLSSKRTKLLKRIREDLKNASSTLTLEDIFSSGNSQETDVLQNELREMILFHRQNLNYRKYWWIWLDIISLSYTELSSEYQEFQKLESLQEDIKYHIQIDLDYPRKYIQQCNYYQELLVGINQKIEKSLLKPKKSYKDVNRDIADQIAGAKERMNEKEVTVPSFIGMQLKNYIKVSGEVKELDPKHLKKTLQKSNRKLKETIQHFLSQLEGIILI